MSLSLGEFMSAAGLASGLLGMILAALASRGDRAATLTCGCVSAFTGIMLAMAAYDTPASAQHASVAPAATPNASVDYRGLSEAIAASHHNMPLIILGVTAVAIAALALRAIVRIVEINAQRPHYEQTQKRLEGPHEVNRGNLPAVRRGD